MKKYVFICASIFFIATICTVAQTSSTAVQAPDGPRARALGVPFEGTPGPLDSITDVKGVEVGFRTLISGEGKLQTGVGPVRTGVTAIFPRGKSAVDPVFAGWFTENGNGEMTGTTWVEESGFLYGPVMITNTHSVGVVRDAVIAWQVKHGLPAPEDDWWSLPVVAETWDGYLNDINGFHVKQEDAFAAMDDAHSGPIAEGNVGGGTGMICFEFKGGTGSASRVLPERLGGYTVGVLVQCNFGTRHLLRIAGTPVGYEITDHPVWGDDTGSIIVVVATDAPLLPTQMKRIAKRVTLGLGRLGSISGDESGDIFIAFSTGNPGVGLEEKKVVPLQMLPNDNMDALFEATVQATEEAVVNAMVAAKTMTGANGHTVEALPHDKLREVLKKYNRLADVKQRRTQRCRARQTHRRRHMRGFISGVILTLLIICVGGFLIAKKGYMSFNADQEPSLVESKLAMTAMDASTDRHAPDAKNPITASEENIVAGTRLYVDHCAGCHGVPTNPESQFSRSFYPTVPAFFKDAPDMPENQNFYIIQHGVRWTGMPAWNKTLNETQLWQIVTFLSNIEKLPPAAMKEFQPPGSNAPPPVVTPAPMPMTH